MWEWYKYGRRRASGVGGLKTHNAEETCSRDLFTSHRLIQHPTQLLDSFVLNRNPHIHTSIFLLNNPNQPSPTHRILPYHNVSPRRPPAIQAQGQEDTRAVRGRVDAQHAPCERAAEPIIPWSAAAAAVSAAWWADVPTAACALVKIGDGPEWLGSTEFVCVFQRCCWIALD